MKLDDEYKCLCEEYISEQNKIDKLKLNYLNDTDIEVCSYVSGKIFEIESLNMVCGKQISLCELIDLSFEEMRIFGEDIINRLKKILAFSNFNACSNDVSEYSCNVSYFMNYVTNSVVKDSGRVIGYNVPYEYFERYAYSLVHEHIHALKDTNYNEYKNGLTLGETLPIFMEFIMFDNVDILRKSILRDRLFDTFINCREFDILNDGISTNNTRSIYEYVRTFIGCYLNSFYYAVILYYMYKENKLKILDLVSRVLKHELTTLELLEQLGIYGDIKGEVFEKEMGNIKRLIK